MSAVIRRVFPVLQWVMLALTLTLPAQAQENGDVTFDFRLEAKPLSQALADFSRTTRRQVAADSDAIRGFDSNAVSGRMTAQAALEQMVAGKGVELVIVNGRSFALRIREGEVSPNEVRQGIHEEVYVYGQLLERSLQDTQTSVSIVTGEELDRSVDKDLFDVIDRIPGVNAEGGGFGFVIRGVPSGGVGGSGSGPTINVQIDGASVPNGQALRTGSLSTWDLEQVEVLRGPQSTQQGPSSLAGAIILRSKDPGFEQEFKLRGDYGSFNETRVAMAANLPVSDQWALRLTYEDYESDGDIENVFTGEDNAQEFLQTIRGKLRFKPHARFNAVFSYTRSENRQGNQSIDDRQFPARRVTNQLSYDEGKTDTIALLAEYVINENWRFRSETTHLQSDYELFIPIQALDPRNSPGGRTVDDTSTTQELKLLYNSGNLTGVFGAYYQRLEKDLFFEALVPDTTVFDFPPGSAVFGNTFDSEVDNFAIFGEAEYDFSSKWTFVAGLRVDSENQETATTQFSVFTPDPLGLSASGEAVDLDADYSALLPKASVIYHFNNAMSLSFTAQRAYRAGGAATDFTGSAYEFDPEYSNNYELALRSMLLDERAAFNANLYYTDYTDMQVGIPGPSGTFVDSTVENAGQATLWGIEILTELQVTDNLEVYANVGYADTEFDDYIGADATGAPADLSGNAFSQAPNWTGSVGGSYFFGNGFEADLSVNHTDESYYTVRNLAEELNKPFTLVNARLGYRSNGAWSAYLYTRNLFDKQYLSRKRTAGSSTAGDSRVIGISLLADF